MTHQTAHAIGTLIAIALVALIFEIKRRYFK